MHRLKTKITRLKMYLQIGVTARGSFLSMCKMNEPRAHMAWEYSVFYEVE